MLSSRRIIIFSSKIIFVIIVPSRLGDRVYKLFVCTKKKLMVGWVKDLGGGGEEEVVVQKKKSPDFKPPEVGISGLYAVH